MTDGMNTVAEHPKVAVSASEVARVRRNMALYAGRYENVAWRGGDGVEHTRPFVPMHIVKMAASEMATLLYNERCRVNIAQVHGEAKDYLEKVLGECLFDRNFGMYLEAMYATGGLAIRPYYAAGESKIKLSWALADRFFPLRANSGEVTDGVFLNKSMATHGGKQIWHTLLEFHEWDGGDYVISHELYESEDAGRLGKQVTLGSVDKYAMLPEVTRMVGLRRPLFVYLKPAQMNNIDPDSPLGVGICDNAQHSIEVLNLLHDKLYQHIKRSRSGIVVDQQALVTHMENGQVWQMPDEDGIYLPIPGGSLDGKPYEAVDIALEPAGYIEAINFEVRNFEAQIGLSGGTFSFDGASGLKTATEVVSEKSRTYQTRGRETVALEAGVQHLVYAILALSKAVGLYGSECEVAVSVDFDDGVFQDKDAQLDYYGRALQMGLMPRKEAIKRANGLTDAEAAEWAALVAKENSVAETSAAASGSTEITGNSQQGTGTLPEQGNTLPT